MRCYTQMIGAHGKRTAVSAEHVMSAKETRDEFRARPVEYFVRGAALLNAPVALMGRVSFSAYLLHFAVIELVLNRHRSFFHMDAAGWNAIAVFAGATLVVIALTCVFSTITYLTVEKPMMRLAKRLTTKRVAASVP